MDYLEYFIVFELICEKVLFLIRDEIFYFVVVVVDLMKWDENDKVYV